MINIDVEEELKQVIVDSGLLAMNKRADKVIAEIRFFDGYSEFPFKYYDENNKVIIEEGADYTEDRKKSFSTFMGDLYKLCETRKGFNKGDKKYWNHCVVVIKRSGESDIIFDYSEKIDQDREKELQESLGTALYEQYKKEREEGGQPAPVNDTDKIAPVPSVANELSIDQLLGVIYQELVNELSAPWQYFQVEAEIFEHQGKEVVSNYYRYKPVSSDVVEEFTPSNIVVLGNATKKIHKKMSEENDGWRKAAFRFNSDKSVNISVLEK